MYCRYCGKENLDDSTFCEHCGKQLRTEKSDAKTTFSASRLAAKSREIAADLEQKTTHVQRTAAPKKKWPIIGILAIAAVVVLGVAVFAAGADKKAAPAPGKEELTRVISKENNGMQIIYVADGWAASQRNSTEHATLYAYEFSEDGLPKTGRTVYYDGSTPASVIHYAFEEDGIIQEYADLTRMESELDAQEFHSRLSEIEYKLMQVLQAHQIDFEKQGFRIVGMKDSRVMVSFENGILDFQHYNDRGEKTGREIYYREKLMNQYSYTYHPDGKLKMMEILLQSGMVVRNEYAYDAAGQLETTHMTILQDGNGVSTTVIEAAHDENGMLVTNYDKDSGTTTCTYHYQKLQVPVDSLQKLYSVYDHIGIRYFLGDEDTVVTDTLTESEISAALEKANIAW